MLSLSIIYYNKIKVSKLILKDLNLQYNESNESFIDIISRSERTEIDNLTAIYNIIIL